MKKKITISVTVIALATILIAPKTITKGNASSSNNEPIDHITPPTITLAADKEYKTKSNDTKSTPKASTPEPEVKTEQTSVQKSVEKPATPPAPKEKPSYQPNSITYNNTTYPIVIGDQERVNQLNNEWVNANYHYSKNNTDKCPEYKFAGENKSIWLVTESIGCGKTVWDLDSFIFTDINNKSKKYVFIGTTETLYYESQYTPDDLWFIMLGYGGDTIVLQTCDPDSNDRGIARGYIFVPEDKVPANGEITVTTPNSYLPQSTEPQENIEYIDEEYITDDENVEYIIEEYIIEE